MSCAEYNPETPYWNGNKCAECPQNTAWDWLAQSCVHNCQDGEVRVGASCEPENTTCPEGTIREDDACIACGPGEIAENGECVCDPARHLARGSDGNCQACTSELLEFDQLA